MRMPEKKITVEKGGSSACLGLIHSFNIVQKNQKPFFFKIRESLPSLYVNLN